MAEILGPRIAPHRDQVPVAGRHASFIEGIKLNMELKRQEKETEAIMNSFPSDLNDEPCSAKSRGYSECEHPSEFHQTAGGRVQYLQKTNMELMEPKKLVVGRCFSFSKGGIFRFHVSFRGCTLRKVMPIVCLRCFAFVGGATSN